MNPRPAHPSVARTALAGALPARLWGTLAFGAALLLFGGCGQDLVRPDGGPVFDARLSVTPAEVTAGHAIVVEVTLANTAGATVTVSGGTVRVFQVGSKQPLVEAPALSSAVQIPAGGQAKLGVGMFVVQPDLPLGLYRVEFLLPSRYVQVDATFKVY